MMVQPNLGAALVWVLEGAPGCRPKHDPTRPAGNWPHDNGQSGVMKLTWSLDLRDDGTLERDKERAFTGAEEHSCDSLALALENEPSIRRVRYEDPIPSQGIGDPMRAV